MLTMPASICYTLTIRRTSPLILLISASQRFRGVVQGQLIDAGNAQALAQIDVVFPIVHGTLGEDGSLQGMLRMANLPFVGSDVLGSAACMDKDVTKRLLRDAGLNIAPFVTLTRANRDKHSFAQIRGATRPAAICETSKSGLVRWRQQSHQRSAV